MPYASMDPRAHALCVPTMKTLIDDRVRTECAEEALGAFQPTAGVQHACILPRRDLPLAAILYAGGIAITLRHLGALCKGMLMTKDPCSRAGRSLSTKIQDCLYYSIQKPEMPTST